MWPTALYECSLPGADSANELITRLVLDLDEKQADLTTEYRQGDLFDNPHPVIRWLRDCVRTSVRDFLRDTGVDYDPEFSIHAWANVNRLGDYHSLHNHPHSYLSGTYYVAMPSAGGHDGGRRSDLTPGAISLYDPRPQANMNAIAGDAQIDAALTLSPDPGTLMIWPAFLHHEVHPNLSDSPRISISFNVMIKQPSSWLP